MSQTRTARIDARLRDAFAPTHLEVIDDSHLHAGHAGAQDGKGHFRVLIVASAFAGKSALQRHRLVYSALREFMHTDIHALSIDARTPAS